MRHEYDLMVATAELLAGCLTGNLLMAAPWVIY